MHLKCSKYVSAETSTDPCHSGDAGCATFFLFELGIWNCKSSFKRVNQVKCTHTCCQESVGHKSGKLLLVSCASNKPGLI